MGSRRYDSRTTVFSPEGRLYQVEYALEAISHAGMSLGILANDGVVLAAERKVTSKLLEQQAEKIYRINDGTVCSVAGYQSDASILIDYLREQGQSYLRTYGTEMPVENLVRRVCDLKQGYTQHGGLRPFGVSLVYAGYDESRGFQLYQSNPSGNYGGWKATSVGSNNATAQTLLKQEYKDDLSLNDACNIAIKVLSKTLDATSLRSDRLEFATVRLKDDGSPVISIFSADEVESLLKANDLAAKPEEEDD
ncbi:hypothetical protein CANCADRAFT_138320 [Tortispora caseinolytica NRRL Y-17796]|uniref:Proteasome subunit alpha type n=1 Tax=Tortispora caseinolytica NRRL Y-17796 TaxID=767744 RepID=A0A1E4TC32_9ASCO|nr:hypothetical protein CANCADRAFT_138320 [Tortispora caseinolytica NRRL Y-17796]